MAKMLKNYPKIDMLALGGLIFEILGGFWRSSIFDEILGRAKVDQKSIKSDIWVARRLPDQFFGVGLRQGAAPLGR